MHCKCMQSCINAANESQEAAKDHSIVNRLTSSEHIDPFQKLVKFLLTLGKLLWRLKWVNATGSMYNMEDVGDTGKWNIKRLSLTYFAANDWNL